MVVEMIYLQAGQNNHLPIPVQIDVTLSSNNRYDVVHSKIDALPSEQSIDDCHSFIACKDETEPLTKERLLGLLK